MPSDLRAQSAPVYSYSEREAWQRRERALLDAHFYPHFAEDGQFIVLGHSPGSVAANRKLHIDVFVRAAGAVQTLALDEKIDRKLRSTFFAETWSDREREKPGWMVEGVSDADLLLWAFKRLRPPGLVVYVLRFPEFRAWFWRQFNLFPGRFGDAHQIRNQEGRRRWVTEGFSVPIADVPTTHFLRHKELVTAQATLL